MVLYSQFVREKKKYSGKYREAKGNAVKVLTVQFSLPQRLLLPVSDAAVRWALRGEMEGGRKASIFFMQVKLLLLLSLGVGPVPFFLLPTALLGSKRRKANRHHASASVNTKHES